MLQLILGKPSSGKTFTILEKIKMLNKIGEKCVLIVPEQFTFEAERLILKELGDKSALEVEVLSFSRLYDQVGNIIGGVAGTLLEDAHKVIFMKRALNYLKEDLKLWRKYSNSISFAKTMLDTVGEFKINGCSADDLLNTADNIENPSLSAKLKEITLIYKQYDILVGEKFIDPTDSLTKLYNMLESYNYFKDKNVFLDSFKGFTGQQYKILDRIICQADNVYLSLTDDVNNKKEFGVYTNIRSSAEQVKSIAKKYAVEIKEPLVLTKTYFNGSALSGMEAIMSGSDTVDLENDGSVVINKENNIYDEAEAVARTIRRLVRTENYRYRDFVIIARDAEYCKEAVINACAKNSISCFYDKRVLLSAFPLSVAVESVISACDFNSDDILRFNKTGLGNLSFSEISELENYIYLWNIEGNDWLKEWDMDPRGFTTNPINEDEFNAKISLLNNLRIKAVTPIINFKSKFNQNAKSMVEAIYNLFLECEFSEKLLTLSQKADENYLDYSSDIMKSAYEQYIGILNSLVRCYGNMSISKDEFSESLHHAVSLGSVGVIPQMLDQVTFGSADRIRPSRPKVAFIIGANQGIFPQFAFNNGLFNIIERRNLINVGLNISDNSVYSAIDEEYLVYCNVCCPSDKLYISYSEQTVSGEELQPSAFVLKAIDKLSITVNSLLNGKLNKNNAPETVDSAFTDYCRSRINTPGNAITISDALSSGDIGYKIEHIENTLNSEYKNINPQTAEKLYGKNLKLSATKFDTFKRCQFSYFCRYGLGAKKLQPAQFDVMQRGTVVHFVLERLITEYGDKISTLTNEELDNLTDRYIELYLDTVSGYRSSENEYNRFLVSRISRSLKEVVHHIAKELSQSDFKPVACELAIGTENAEIELTFPFDKGKISVLGSIDRVDEYNGFIRIIDYKTGSKSFKLPDILFGLNLQMLIYLYAVIRARGLSDSNVAGILYQPSKRDTNDNGLAMNGLLPLEPELITAMDKSGNGEFVPKLPLKKDGTVSKRSNSYIEKDNFTEIFDYIELLMRNTGNSIVSGDISVSPTDGRESPACKYCDFSTICGFGDKTPNKVPDLTKDEVIEKIKEAKTNGI